MHVLLSSVLSYFEEHVAGKSLIHLMALRVTFNIHNCVWLAVMQCLNVVMPI